MSKTYIVDGNSLLFRAFYATYYSNRGGVMRAKDGTPTNAIFSFANMILQIRSEISPEDRFLVCFDSGKDTFRSKEFKEYKAQRTKAPDELVLQFPLSRELLDCMNIVHIESDDYEADDLAGSFAKLMSNLNEEVIIYTSDKDYLQLVDQNINIHMVKNSGTDDLIVTLDNIESLYQLKPKQVIDFKGIAGDSSDNYKGIPGVGEKSAITLLSKYGDIDNIYEHVDELKPAMKEKFITFKDECYKCRHLAEIVTDIDLRRYVDETVVKDFDYEKLFNFLNRLNLESTMKKVEKGFKVSRSDYNIKTVPVEKVAASTPSDKPESSNSYKTTYDNIAKDVNDSNSNAESDNNVVEEEETEEDRIEKYHRSLVDNFKLDNDVKFSYCKFVSNFEEINTPVDTIIPLTDTDNENVCFINGLIFANTKNCYFLPSELINMSSVSKLKEFLTSDKEKYTYNLKQLNVILNRLNLPFINNCTFDLSLFYYVLNPNYSFELDKEIDSSKISDDSLFEYGLNSYALLAMIISKNKERCCELLKELDQFDLFDKIEIPLSSVLAKMEIEGVYCDKLILAELNIKYKQKLKELTEMFISLSPNKEININSPKQVKELLFNTLGLGKKIKENKRATDIETLNLIKHEHPIVPILIEYRKFNKIVFSYTDTLPKHILNDGKIHAIFHQNLTQTGRLSMSDPNLQQISVRSSEGREMRKAFYPPKGYKLLSFDYSQIELRMLASVANNKPLLELFSLSADIHRATASKVFKVPLEEVTSEMRRQAKAVNFGLVYGMTLHGLAIDLGISYGEAKKVLSNFFESFPGIDAFQQNIIENAQKNEYVKTILNRKRYLLNINNGNIFQKKESYRQAVNTVIQGSAADLIKVAMLNVDKLLQNYETKMILQVHDELIFIVPDHELETIFPLIKKEMENALSDKISCPLSAEGVYGDSWFELK